MIEFLPGMIGGKGECARRKHAPGHAAALKGDWTTGGGFAGILAIQACTGTLASGNERTTGDLGRKSMKSKTLGEEILAMNPLELCDWNVERVDELTSFVWDPLPDPCKPYAAPIENLLGEVKYL